MRELAAYLALRGAVAVLGILPEPLMRGLGRLAGRIWHATDRRRRSYAQAHMRRLGLPAGAAREVFASYGRYWAESFWVRPRRFAQLRSTMTVDGLEHLEAAVGSGRGVIAVLPHIGNWEAAALIAIDLELPLVAVAERLPNRRITEWFTRQREMFGIEIVLTGAGRVGPQLAEAIEAGKLLALLSDRDVSGRGVKVEFFGEPTTLPTGPASLARKTGAAVLPVGIYFKTGPGHHAVIHPPLDLAGAEDLAPATRRIAEKLEEIIRRDPAQWHLVQPNWPSDAS